MIVKYRQYYKYYKKGVFFEITGRIYEIVEEKTKLLEDTPTIVILRANGIKDFEYKISGLIQYQIDGNLKFQN